MPVSLVIQTIWSVIPKGYAKNQWHFTTIYSVKQVNCRIVLIYFLLILGCILTAYSCVKDHSVWVQIPRGLKITEMTSPKLSLIFRGFLWVKTPEKAWCPAVFTAGHLFQAVIMVPPAGIEPARYNYRGILNPLRLPVPPWRRFYIITEPRFPVNCALHSP